MERDLFPMLYVRDLGAALRFYRDWVGMSVVFRMPVEGEATFFVLQWGGAKLGIGTYDHTPGLEARPMDRPPAGRGFELCLYVDDVDALTERVRREGIVVLVEPRDQPWGERLAYVRDPEGNTVMLAASRA